MKPTAEQIQAYEIQHKSLFVLVVLANRTWLAMPKMMGKFINDKNSKQYKAWIAYGNKIKSILQNWVKRQVALERAGVPKFDLKYFSYFFDKKRQLELEKFALTYIKPDSIKNLPLTKGIGFIPLIVWGVIAIAGLFTAAYIVDETTTTAQEKEDLMSSTKKTLQELNVPPEQAAQIISQTQKEASESKGLFSGGGFMNLLLIGGAAYLGINLINKKNG